MDNTGLPKHALNYKPRGRRDRGRLRKRWQSVDAGTGQTTQSKEEDDDYYYIINLQLDAARPSIVFYRLLLNWASLGGRWERSLTMAVWCRNMWELPYIINKLNE
jgi:hypothetical protein